jgi:hypothetical protein
MNDVYVETENIIQLKMLFASKAVNAVLSFIAYPFRSARTRRPGVILAMLLTAVTSFGQSYNWKPVVIKGGGFITGIITHPNAHGVIYARADIGGAYRWNPTNNWIPLLDFATNSNLGGVESLAIDPSDSNRLYIAASRGSPAVMLVSTNQGATFSQFTPPFALNGNVNGRSNGERMAVDPNSGNILFYGTRTSGLYKSINYGANWTQVSSFPVTTTSNSVGLVFVEFIKSSGSPGSATPAIFVGVSQTNANDNLFMSTNGGVTWTNVPTIAPASQMPHHAAQDGLGNMYVTFNNNEGPNNITAGSVIKLNLSTLATTLVTPPKPSGAEGGFAGVSVDRQNPNTVVVSTMDRWYANPPAAPWDVLERSVNGGVSWVEISPDTLPASTSAPWSVAQTPHWAGDVEIDPYNSNQVFFITGYGIVGSTNLTAGSVKFAFMSDGIEETVPLGLASPPSGPYLLSAHGDIGGFRHNNLDVSPPLTDYFSTHRVTSGGIDFAQNNPNVIVRLFTDVNWGSCSLDGGATWTDFITNSLPAISGYGNIAVSADGSRFVWIPSTTSSATEIAYYSTNNGANWTASTGGPTGNRFPFSDRVNPGKFYIYSSSSGGRIYISTDGGMTYTPGAAISSGLTPIAVAGYEGNILLPRGINGLSRSTNSGATFTTVTSVQQASFVAVGKAATGQSYPSVFISGQVTNVMGIFRSDDQGASWVRINDNQHQFGLASIHTFCADPRVFGRVYFGTEGLGIVYGDIISNTPPALAGISNWTVNVGQTVAFSASATDTDQPPQILTFSVLSGPGKATLNTNTGAFSWRPQVTDANTTNLFALEVADNGTPSLSATQNFSVTVNPLTLPTLAMTMANGQFTLQANGMAGPDYEVQSSTNLTQWSANFVTNSPIMPFIWTDTNTINAPARFYRVVVGPPLP